MAKSNQKPVWESLKYSFYFILIFWIIQIFQSITGISLIRFGIIPRTIYGLPGILTSPFIHADFQHLMANSIPFFVLSFFLFLFYRKSSWYILSLIWITSGLLTWVIGRPASHIGASTIIYGLASFLVFGGIMSRTFKLIIVSVVVMFLYSGLIWGILPQAGQISWEGHLAGAVSGFIWAYKYRNALLKEKS